MNRHVKKSIVLLLFIAAILQQVLPAYASVKPKKIIMNTKQVSLLVGSTYKLKVKKVLPDKAKKAVSYKSKNKKIAKVNSKGVITAMKKGNTKIIVSSRTNKKVKASVKVAVKAKRKSLSVPAATGTPAPVNTSTPASVNTDTPSPISTGTAVPTPLQTAQPVFNPEYNELVSRSDLTYTGMIDHSPYGIPVGNGRFGGPVWEGNAGTLSMQLNHTDTFMYNDASAQSTDESGGLGRLDIDFGSAVFNDGTEHKLSLYEGKLDINTDDVSVNVIANNEKDAVLIQVTDLRSAPSEININLNMLRNPSVKRGLFNAISNLSLEDNEKTMTLKQVFSEECSTGITENNHYCSTAVAVSVVGREYEASIVNNKQAQISLPAENGSFTIVIGGESSMAQTVDTVGSALQNMNSSLLYETVFESNTKWWSDFWQKSYVYLPSQKDFEIRRNYYMYLAAISNRGNFPSKYNGGIWIAQGDRRDWGNWYWNWNQDSLYQPLNSANHTELMEPLFKLRERCYENYKTAAKQLWGLDNTDALFIGETSGVLGAEILPDHIASDVKQYLDGSGSMTSELKAFGNSRNSFLVPWNWKLSNNSVSYVTHTLVATQETAEYYWQKYQYTKDLDWLRDHAYAFIKGAAELYRNYDGFIKEEDGYYHFYRTNLHEHIWGGKDVIDDLSLARGIFAVAIKASELLDTDEALRTAWQECLDHLAPYPMSSDPDAIGFTVSNKSGNETWAQGLKPASLVRALEGSESPQFKMLEKFDVFNMETRDQNRDNGDWQIAINTFYDSPGYLNQFLNSDEDKNGSSRFLEDAAKMGRSEELEVMFNTQYKYFHDTPNLLYDEGDYYSAEGYGTWSAAIQTALNQSLAPAPSEDTVIRVFPAWPRSWDAKYKLLAKGGFLVSSSMTNGDIEYVEIESQLGETCQIRNPWNTNITLYRNGQQSETISAQENDRITFDTVTGENIVIVREGTSPDQYRTSTVIG